MDIEHLIKAQYTVPLYYFVHYFNSGQYERAACEIKYSFETCLLLSTKEIIRFLIENDCDLIFCTIAYSLLKHGCSINQLTSVDDFFFACSHCSATVIRVLANHNEVKFIPISNNNENSPLKLILDRNDPQLLLKCLKLIPELVSIETQPTSPLYYVLEHKLDNLIDELWILINYFDIQEYDLLIVARNWECLCPKKPLIPILEELFSKHMLDYQIYIEEARAENDPALLLTEPTDITDLNCLDVKTNMQDADRFRQFLTDRNNETESMDPYDLHFTVDPRSKDILMQLPYELMKDPSFFLNSNLYLKKKLIGEDAVGEGPVQDMFNAYFKQISSLNDYFDSNDNSTSILPTNKSGNQRELQEKKCVFYGLGIVFLKILIDLRPIGNFHELIDTNNNIFYDSNDSRDTNTNNSKGSLNCSLHPWIFQALLKKMETDPKKIFYEALLFDNGFYNVMRNDTDLTDVNYLTSRIYQSEMYLNSRGIFYQALYDGFSLNYINGLTPSEFKENLVKIRNELSKFYEKIKPVSPRALQFLLVGPSIINAEFLLSRFDFEPYKYIDTSGQGNDLPIQFINEDWDKGATYTKSKEIFKQVMTEWCNEEYQQNIRDFLRYLSGVPTLSPLHQHKWKIAFDFSVEKNAILMVWACENIVRSPLFESVDQCKKIILETIKMHQSDPISRDII
ncbi:hypothetical protein M9Y10_003802 [Tritrichomonas musculus]|uniref:HECT domain-containing protein n=1 Tax=Tritrichomonas musculus TaxID=1915356 RepID=A0ABR2JQA1_9EUKA